MKVQIFILFLMTFVIITPLTCKSQDTLSLGINLGPALTSVYGTLSGGDRSPILGYSLGINGTYRCVNKLKINAGIEYSKKGYHFVAIPPFRPDDPGFFYFKESYYLGLPVSLRFFPGRKERFFIEAGVYVSHLVSNYLISKNKYISDLLSRDPEKIVRLRLSKKMLDIGFLIGLGYQIPLNQKSNLLLQIRDSMGLVNDTSIQIFGNKSFNNSLNFMVGYVYVIR